MPSPFPGMDPYLEGSEWVSVHTELATEIAKQLVPKVSPKYTVRPVRRFVMDMPDEIVITTTKRHTYPDVGVYKVREAAPVYEGGATATISPAPPLQMVTVLPEKVPVVSIEIRDTAERELVTAIEILSPVNKRGEGYEEYIGKRHRIFSSFTHLLEIDLLRRGKRLPMRDPLPKAPYFIFLSRAEKRPVIDVWPIQLPMKLPVIPIPLLPGDKEVTLDLQLALDTAYDAYQYNLSVDYSQPPEIPLEGETAVWAAQRLQQTGYPHEK